MTEFEANFPREWFEFQNPLDAKEIFKCDLTWLTSNWNCIFGAGCQGIDKKFPDQGCCSDGAYYFDKADERRVTAAAKRLTPEMWQNHDLAHKGKSLKITEIGLDEDRKTRKVKGTCIFFNRSDFDSKYFGCALHHLAEKEDRHYLETKPDICWQLPLRRSWEKREVGDAKYSVVVIGEYTREAWGPGGADLDWYCTSNTEAHNGKNPVYLSNRRELIELMNEPAYEILKERCEAIMSQRINNPKNLPLFVIHPATAKR